MNIAFFDHRFHQKTLSSHFFVDILRKQWDVDVFYVDFHNENDVDILFEEPLLKYEILIFWQVIPAAAILSKLSHKRIVLIPMYDACCTMSHFQWHAYRNFHFISFSWKLHNLFCNLGMHSLYVRYAPDLINKYISKTGDENSLRAFVWRRNLSLNIEKLFGSLKKIGVKTIIFHNSPDVNDSNSLRVNATDGLEIQYTNGWFETHEEYLKIVSECDVYVAPRKFEGIGLSFLEAMSLGLCVIAPNQATMNEYIVDGYNGLLFENFKSIGKKKYNICEIRNQALNSFCNYSKEWKKSIPEIYSFLNSINSCYEGNFKSPYLFVIDDVKMFCNIRLFPFLKRKMKLSDY